MSRNVTRQRPGVEAFTSAPLIVELLGAAGSGKTTLVRKLTDQGNNIQSGVTPGLIDCVPFFARRGLLLCPFLHSGYRRSRSFRWYEARCMLRLEAWRSRLRRPATRKADVVLLDHGPIFKLVRLREFGPEFTKSAIYQRWWDQLLHQWSDTLDLVVWLDAPDSVLWQRVHERGTRHRIKGRPVGEALTFLKRYRSSYEAILAKWENTGGPPVLRCNTELDSPEQTTEKILSAFAHLTRGYSGGVLADQASR